MRSDKKVFEIIELPNNEDVDPDIVNKLHKEILREQENWFQKLIRKIFSIK